MKNLFQWHYRDILDHFLADHNKMMKDVDIYLVKEMLETFRTQDLNHLDANIPYTKYQLKINEWFLLIEMILIHKSLYVINQDKNNPYYQSLQTLISNNANFIL